MTPYYSDDRATLYRGDALAVLRELPDASVDALITDPPYSSGGAFRGDRANAASGKYLPSWRPNSPEYVNFTGDNRDQRSFAYWSTLWLSESLRVTKPGGVLCCFADWRQLPVTTDAIQAGGWVWRGIAVWDKTRAARPTSGRFRHQAEFVVWASNGPMPMDNTRPSLPGVFQHVAFRGKEHPTGKPEGLMTDLLGIVPPGGVVLDPFMGSGTTGVAAVSNNRRFVGIELVSHYAEVAERRIRIASGQTIAAGAQEAIDFGGAA